MLQIYIRKTADISLVLPHLHPLFNRLVQEPIVKESRGAHLKNFTLR